MATSWDYRPQQTDDDELQLVRIASQTFGFSPSLWPTVRERIGRENLRVVCGGGRVRGGLAFYPVGQWFGGRVLPMAGIALVCISPEDRGRGVARQLLTQTLRELHDRNFALATLFASTQPVYRQIGFEQGGTSHLLQLPLLPVAVPSAPLQLTPIDPLEPEAFASLAEQRAARSNGNLQRSPGLWQRLFDPRDNPTPMRGYLIGDRSQPEGYVIFYQRASDEPRHGQLVVRDMVAESPAALATLWDFLYGHRALAKHVVWPAAGVDPLLLIPSECPARIVQFERWMTRLVNVRQALAGRGYPVGPPVSLHLEVVDSLLPTNGGRMVLHVANGEGEVEEGGEGKMQLDVAGLSCLFTGLYDAHALGLAGRLRAEETTARIATHLFAGSAPWMPDRF